MRSRELALPKGIPSTHDATALGGPVELHETRPDHACWWQQPNVITARMEEIPSTAAALLAKRIIENTDEQELWKNVRATFRKTSPNEFDWLYRRMRLTAKEDTVECSSRAKPDFGTLFPREQRSTNRIRITGIKIDAPVLKLLPRITDAIPILPTEFRELLSGTYALPLEPGVIVSYPFEITRYMHVHERTTSLRGNMHSVIVAAITQRGPKIRDLSYRFFLQTIREFDKDARSILELDRSVRDVLLALARVEQYNRSQHPVSSGWGLGGKR